MEGGISSGTRCPGESCQIWSATAGTFEEKSKVCLDCGVCKGKPPLRDSSQQSAEITDEDLADDIEEIFDIADWENAGIKTDWSIYPFEFQLMFLHLRKAEGMIKAIYEMRMQAFLKGWMSGD